MAIYATRHDPTRCAAASLEPGDIVKEGTVQKVERLSFKGYRTEYQTKVTFTDGRVVQGCRLTFAVADPKPCAVEFGPRAAPCPNEATTQYEGTPACDVCFDEKQQDEIDEGARHDW